MENREEMEEDGRRWEVGGEEKTELRKGNGEKAGEEWDRGEERGVKKGIRKGEKGVRKGRKIGGRDGRKWGNGK